jgi:hypothetical protein
MAGLLRFLKTFEIKKESRQLWREQVEKTISAGPKNYFELLLTVCNFLFTLL